MVGRIAKNLTVQVIVAAALGVLIGVVRPDWGVALEPLFKGFVKLVKFIVAPVIFLTIVGGIAGMGDLKRVGRVGLKALVYFEVVTTLALVIGLFVVNAFHPGRGIKVEAFKNADVSDYVNKSESFSKFLLNIIPDGFLSPFTGGDHAALQVLFLALIVGAALLAMGERAAWFVERTERLTELMFRIVALLMRTAPIGALGAMAFTVGKHGTAYLQTLAGLMACVYTTMAVFIIVVLGLILRACGVGLWSFLRLIKDEILLVLGTSSSESALPRMVAKMERAGCGKGVVGLVIPAGYSFNLDGTSIYLSMAVVFIAQAYGVEMSVGQQISILALLMLTSKGAAAVTGGGLITLAATLSATHVLPAEGIALVVGVDRFMSEARAVTNLIGNGVATIAVSRMEGEFDVARYNAAVAEARPEGSAVG